MDLWNRTVPEKLPSDRVSSENSRCREPRQSAHGRSALTLPIVDDGLTLPFDMDITITYGGVPQQSPGARDNETPMGRLPMPPMIQGEPPRDFEDDMRGLMEGERYPSCILNPRKHPQERGTTPENISTNRPTERPQFVTSIVRDDRAAHSGYGHGAVGGSAPHESSVGPGYGHPRPETILMMRGMSEVPVFIMKEFYLLDHILEAELLHINHKVIFMRNIHPDMA